MTSKRVRRAISLPTVAVALWALALAGGCAVVSAGAAPVPSGTPSATAAPGETPHYAVFAAGVPAEGWTLAEAVAPTGDSAAVLHAEDPRMDWFAEYYGPAARGAEPDYLRLSGVRRSLAEVRARDVGAGVEPVDGEIAGRDAFWAAGSDARLAIAWDEGYTLLVSGSGVTPARLRDLAANLRPATPVQWTAAGGQIGYCPAFGECTDPAAAGS